jgi:hypothetical protein
MSTTPEDAPNAPAADLPVTAVTLFSSGVAYTLREGEVDAGEASVALTFRTTQVSDILKSLVLLDEGGTARPAVLPSRDPVGRTLQSFAVDVTHNRSRADLLRQLRGAPLRVETVAGEAFEGRIVGVEEREEAAGNDRTVTVEALSLLTDAGLVAVDLPRTRLLRLLDARLDRELRDALAVLASGSDDARRTLTLGFSGAARRRVRVGYITEAPLWRVSYRLVLDDEAKPYLQGWALVENTSDDDWSGVALSLVSGRPVSFIQDLYQPLYVSRPVVPPDVVASPFPQTHGGDLLAPDMDDAFAPEEMARGAFAAAAPPMVAMSAPAPAPAGGGALFQRSRVSAGALRESGPAQAEGRQAGELFAYHVATPVTLPRQQAAMIPIVSGEAEGEKLSLYNYDADPTHPLNAVRLVNSTGLHLKGGPLTVFDGGVYAGDARMEEVPPGDSRLITYAVDLAVEGERRQFQHRTDHVGLSIKRGMLILSHRQRATTHYTIKNKAMKERLVYVEHPYRSDWELTDETPAPAERSARFYRFAVRVAPNEVGFLSVVEEQPLSQTASLTGTSLNVLLSHVSGGEVPQRLKDAMAAVVERRRNIEELDARAAQLEIERQTLREEQDRIRKNMTALEKDSALYRRYVDELDRQETRLSQVRPEIDGLRAESQAETLRLNEYVDNLEVEG